MGVENTFSDNAKNSRIRDVGEEVSSGVCSRRKTKFWEVIKRMRHT